MKISLYWKKGRLCKINERERERERERGGGGSCVHNFRTNHLITTVNQKLYKDKISFPFHSLPFSAEILKIFHLLRP